MEELLIALIQKYPVLATVALVMGSLRMVFKPIMAALSAYYEGTPDPNDGGWLVKFKESKVYAGISFALDYAASIKLPK